MASTSKDNLGKISVKSGRVPEVDAMRASDFDDVVEIERGAFGRRAWTPDYFFQRCTAWRITPRVVRLDVLNEPQPAGFVLLEGADRCYRIVRLAVADWARGRRVASALLANALRQMTPQRPRVRMVVEESFLYDQPALIALIRSNGFEATGVMQGDHRDNQVPLIVFVAQRRGLVDRLAHLKKDTD